MTKKAALSLVLLALSGFGGGCSQRSSLLPPGEVVSPAARADGTLTLRIKIPARRKATHRFAPAYVSPATKGMALTFAGRKTFGDVLDLTPANPRCSGSPLECTIRVDVSPGAYAATIDAYDEAPVGGRIPAGAHLLSSAKTAISVSRGMANTFRIALDGVPARIVVSGFPDATAGTAFLSRPFAVTVEDADGYAIVGTYATPIALADGDTSGATVLTTSGADDPPASKLLSSSDAATIGYNGAAIAPAKISAVTGTVIGYGIFAVHLPLFVADAGNAAVKEVPPGCPSSGCVTSIGAGFSSPQGVAVDSSGNVYVTDVSLTSYFTGWVKKVPPNCFSASCIITIGGGFEAPAGIAVDSSGDVFVADVYLGVKKIPAGCLTASCVVPVGGGFSGPEGVAVDAAGDAIVADSSNNALKKVASGCQSAGCVTTIGGGFAFPYGVAVDVFGNIFVTDVEHGAVKKVPPGCRSSACVTTIGGGFSFPWSVTVDGFGDAFVVEDNGALKEVPPGCGDAACVIVLSLGFNGPRGLAML